MKDIELYKSLTRFLLQIPATTTKSAVQLYKEWRDLYHIYEVDCAMVATLLEYIQSAKHENRAFLTEAAKLDHII